MSAPNQQAIDEFHAYKDAVLATCDGYAKQEREAERIQKESQEIKQALGMTELHALQQVGVES